MRNLNKTVEDSCLRKRGVQIVSCRPSIFRGKNVSFDVAPGQFVATKPMESLDETIGFVCENQWNRWTITMASFANIGRLMKKKLAEKLRKTGSLFLMTSICCMQWRFYFKTILNVNEIDTPSFSNL